MSNTTTANRIYLDTLDGVVVFDNCHAEAVAAYREAARKAGAVRTIIANREAKGMEVSETMRTNARNWAAQAAEALDAIGCPECTNLATAPRRRWAHWDK